jgi:hypothetical protein
MRRGAEEQRSTASLLCCAVLCCAVLCCAVLCCAAAALLETGEGRQLLVLSMLLAH